MPTTVICLTGHHFIKTITDFIQFSLFGVAVSHKTEAIDIVELLKEKEKLILHGNLNNKWAHSPKLLVNSSFHPVIHFAQA